MNTCKQKKFTLIEILAAVAIMAILAGIATGVVGYVRNKTKEARTIATIEIIKTALEQYKEKFGYYLPISKGSYVAFHTDKVTSNSNAPAENKKNFNQFVNYTSFIGQGKINGSASGSHNYLIKDGYGQPIYYCYPGKVNKGSYDLGSLGSDGKSGDGDSTTPDGTFGAGDDITNCKQ